jgi:tripartite-type tricarboxylate transporter receptor subunit TctC
LYPNIPTLTELGYRGDLTRVFFGLVAPAGMPRPMIGRLNSEIAEIMKQPAFREKILISRGLEPIGDTPEEFARFLEKDRALAKRIVKEAGLQPK